MEGVSFTRFHYRIIYSQLLEMKLSALVWNQNRDTLSASSVNMARSRGSRRDRFRTGKGTPPSTLPPPWPSRARSREWRPLQRQIDAERIAPCLPFNRLRSNFYVFCPTALLNHAWSILEIGSRVSPFVIRYRCPYYIRVYAIVQRIINVTRIRFYVYDLLFIV